MNHPSQPAVRRIAFIGSYLPRKCGIATYTNDLSGAISAQFPDLTVFTVAMNDIQEGYHYPSQVRFEIPENDVRSYHRAADYLNMTDVDVVSLQHEFGIYGGPAGSHILTLLRDIRMPVVTTLHTVLKDPNHDQLKVMQHLADLSNRLVVMSNRGVDYLQDIYHISADKIDFIPHGIPDVPFVDPNFYKDRFNVEGKIVILTFGLLSRNKGIENVIRAMPEIIKDHPDVVYIVLGATHPNVIRSEGESYRGELENLVKELKLSEWVRFENRFVSQEELTTYIGAADIYITPYLNPQQITSGTLAYTVGAGKAVISTPYWYAEELLDDQRGVIVPFKDPQAIADQVKNLIDNEAERHSIRKQAYLFGREMVWSKVAEKYLETFTQARMEPIPRPRTLLVPKRLETSRNELPPLNLYHLNRMTDNTGLLQHAIFTTPNYAEGYTTDDNARGAIVAVMLESLGDDWFTGAEELASRYLAFLLYAYNRENRRFRNFLSFDRRWYEKVGSEDSHGRSLWGLGVMAGHTRHEPHREVAGMLFNEALPKVVEFNSPRAWAFTLLGIHEYLTRFSGDRLAMNVGKELAQRLQEIYKVSSQPGWNWFENVVTYSNASLSHALLSSGQSLGNQEMIDIGLESLTWLIDQQTVDGVFAPIGNNGFFYRGSTQANFDQQPIEAQATISACIQAYQVTADSEWLRLAHLAFDWYLGKNQLGLPLYDSQTGGCRDGLQPDRVNQNEGAESTLSFYLSLIELCLLEKPNGDRISQNGQIAMLPLKTSLDRE